MSERLKTKVKKVSRDEDGNEFVSAEIDVTTIDTPQGERLITPDRLEQYEKAGGDA